MTALAAAFVRELYPQAVSIQFETSRGLVWYAISLDGSPGYSPLGGKTAAKAWERTEREIRYLASMEHLRMDRARRMFMALLEVVGDR